MILSDKDRKILELAREVRALYAEIDEWQRQRRDVKGASVQPIDHPKHARLKRLSGKLHATIYEGGEFRDDLRHLLDGVTLDTSLLDDNPTQVELV